MRARHCSRSSTPVFVCIFIAPKRLQVRCRVALVRLALAVTVPPPRTLQKEESSPANVASASGPDLPPARRARSWSTTASWCVFGHRSCSRPAALPPCHAHDLSAHAFWQGAAGSMLGPVVFTLQGTAACTVRGRPEVRPIDARGTLLPVRAAPASEDVGRPVALRHGQHVSVMLLWSNYCGPAPVGPLALRIVLPNGHGQLTARAPQSRFLRPRCDSEFGLGDVLHRQNSLLCGV